MAYNEKTRDATYAYRVKSYARISLDLKAEEKEKWKAAANESGQALNAFIKAAVNERIEREQKGKA